MKSTCWDTRATDSIIEVARRIPQGVLPSKEVGGGGLDLTSSSEAKFGAKSGQVHQIRGKTWEVLSPQDAKVGKSPNFGVISEIQRAKFGTFVIYIFGGKIWGSNKNFRGKSWGQAPRPPNMEEPPGKDTEASIHVFSVYRTFIVSQASNRAKDCL